jgi:trigger factor
LDFVGTIESKEFPGGKADNYQIEVGGGQILPEFDSAVVGAQCGEAKSTRVRFPDDYPNRELAGKTADFNLTVREIKEKILPALDDEFAKEHGESGSLEELKSRIRERLKDELEKYQESELKERILNQVIERHSLTPPPAMVDRQTRYLMERYQNSNRADSTADAPSLEETRKALEARAARQVQATLLVEKIAEAENIEVSDSDVQARVEVLARAAGDRAKVLRQYYSRPEARDEIRSQLLFDRTLDFLLANATVKQVETPAETVDDPGKKS